MAGGLEEKFQRHPRVVLRTPLRGSMIRHAMLISFVGRESGRRHTTPIINYVRDGDEVLPTTSHPWWKNLRGEDGADARVELCIKGRDCTGVAGVASDEEAVIGAVEKMLGEQPGYGRWIGVKPKPDGGADREQAARAVWDGLVAVRIKGIGPLKTRR